MHLMGVMWETADFICTNPKCGKVLDGYGNYVTNLKKEVERLRAKYEPDAHSVEVTGLARLYAQGQVDCRIGGQLEAKEMT